MGTLPVLHIARTAWMTVFYNLPWIWKLGKIPLLLGLAAAFAGIGAGFAPDGAPRLSLYVLRGVLLVAAFVAWVPLATRWQRFTLWVVEGKLPDLALRWQRPEWLTLGWIAGFTVAGAVFLVIAGVVAAMMTVLPAMAARALVPLICILWLGLMLRFALVLPAAAIGEQMDPGRSWNRTSPAPLSFLGAMLLAVLPVLALEGVFGVVRMLLPGPALAIVTGVLHPLVGFAGGVVFLAVLALVYRMLSSFSVAAWEAGVMGDPTAAAPAPEAPEPEAAPEQPSGPAAADAPADDDRTRVVTEAPAAPPAGPEPSAAPDQEPPADDGQTQVITAPESRDPEPTPAPDPEPPADNGRTRVVTEAPAAPPAGPEPSAAPDQEPPAADPSVTQVITEPPAGPEPSPAPETPAEEADDGRTRVVTEPPADPVEPGPPVPDWSATQVVTEPPPAPESPDPEATPPVAPADDDRTRVIRDRPAGNDEATGGEGESNDR